MYKKKIIVVGGGPAGMMAAIAASDNGAMVFLIEKNEKLGKKLFITGKGRCNITSACEMDEVMNSILSNTRFMYSSLYQFSNDAVISFFEEAGLKLKKERGDRIFPASDKSSDVIKTLKNELKKRNTLIRINTEVTALLLEAGCCNGVCLKNGEEIKADAVIVATGGLSYESTGSTGDGFRWAREANISVTELRAGLVPIEVKESWIKELQGLSLKNVFIHIYADQTCIYDAFGEMLFTHYGVSGPLIIRASSIVGDELMSRPLLLEIDLKPALTEKMLDQRLLREFELQKNKNFKNVLSTLLPTKLIPIILRNGPILADKKIHEITKAERVAFVEHLKHFTLTLTKLRGFNEAIITRGGISVKEINPGTMESKKYKELYFAGEMIDVDGETGGFNLQIAWSTGHLAGTFAARKGGEKS